MFSWSVLSANEAYQLFCSIFSYEILGRNCDTSHQRRTGEEINTWLDVSVPGDLRRKIPNSNEFEWCMLIHYHPEREGAQLARFNRGSFCHEYETEKLIARKRTSKPCVSRELLDDLVQINHLSNDHNRLKPFGARRDHAETFYMFMSKFPSFIIPPAFKVVIYRPNKIHEKITQFWLVKINAVFT